MNGACSRCGHDGPVHRHHPTGRRDNQPYHPGLIAVLCEPCHRAEHRVWRRCGLDVDTGPGGMLRRLAVWLGRLGTGLSAETVKALAVVVADLADQIDNTGR